MPLGDLFLLLLLILPLLLLPVLVFLLQPLPTRSALSFCLDDILCCEIGQWAIFTRWIGWWTGGGGGGAKVAKLPGSGTL